MEIIKFLILCWPIIGFLAFMICIFVFDWDGFLIPIAGFITIIVMSVWFTFTSMFCTSVSKEEIQLPDKRYELVSINFKNNIEGKFSLGTGMVNGEEYIYYTIKDGNELKRRNTQDYSMIITEEEPYIIVKSTKIVKKEKSWLYSLDDTSETVYESIDFYIPEDLVTQSINID